jgi:nitrite reductase/ring-hydroxylating ferredoxin subunit
LTEQRSLFRALWQLVGLGADLASEGDFVTCQLGDRSVVVSCMRGERRAFHNVCVHRKARILVAPRGNGPLRCPYHNWTYSFEGVPVGIPLRPSFEELTDASGAALALRKCAVDAIGPFVFARFEDRGPPLREQLGASCADLERLGESIGKAVGRIELTVPAPWSVLVRSRVQAGQGLFLFPASFVTAERDGATILERIIPVGPNESRLSADVTASPLDGAGESLVASIRERLEREVASLVGEDDRRQSAPSRAATARVAAFDRACADWGEVKE